MPVKVKELAKRGPKGATIVEAIKKFLEKAPKDDLYSNAELAQASRLKQDYYGLNLGGKALFHLKGYYVVGKDRKKYWGNPLAIKAYKKELGIK